MSALLNGKSRRGPASAPKTETEVTAEVVYLALRSRFNPLRGLTPQLLTTWLDNFWLGWVAYAALVWDHMERRDDVLRNVASKRKKDAARLKRESLMREESDEAKAHAEALDEFYDNISVVNALDQNERGGLALLLRQMMDAVGKYYAVHEIVWQPGETLTAEFRFVPLWFFENRSGNLRFMSIPLGGAEGEPLEEGGWMVTKGDGLMEACSIAYMFKSLPLKDWLSYSDRFGTPGILGRTNAAKGSPAGQSLKQAVQSFGQNYVGVTYGDDGAIKEPIQLISPQGSASTLPFAPLVERMDRAMASLWRGSDLSTMSADNKGASVQEGESDILNQDDAAMLSDTLQYYVDRWVIYQKFGTWQPLAYSQIVVPEKENVDMDLKIDEFLLKAGAKLGERERMEHYGRAAMDATDTALQNPATITERVNDDVDGKKPSNLPNERAADKPALGKLLATSRQVFGEGLALDFQSLRAALAKVIEGDDAGLLERAMNAQAALNNPEVIEQIVTSDGTEKALFNILSAAAATELSETQQTP